MHIDNDCLYRYDIVRYSKGTDECGDSIGSYAKIELYSYDILNRTQKGAWIKYYKDGREKKFVLRTAQKRFACETELEAMLSFIARKKAQIRILTSQLTETETVLRNSKIMLTTMQNQSKNKEYGHIYDRRIKY